MFRTFSKTLTAGALAVTLAATGITATATPAAANGHRNNGAEAAAVFGGLLLLYGLSQAGRNNGNVTIRQNHGGGHGHVHGHGNRHARVAPQQCFIQGRDHNGNFRGYRYRCMQNNVPAAHRLPANCLRNVRTHNGPRTIYRAGCLRSNGWSLG